jgi:hypothetical protein
MSDTLSKISNRILQLQAELDELRIAERVCRAIENGRKPADTKETSEPPKGIGERVMLNDLKGKTVVESATKILSESAQPLHFKVVHERATMRGYRGRKAGKDNSATFWAALSRNKELFEAKGEGQYTLTKNTEKTETTD